MSSLTISRQLAASVVDILFMEGIGLEWGGREGVGELVRDTRRRPDTRALVESASKPIRKLAYKVAASRPGADADDLYQTGMVYALRLASEYRAELGAAFISFVYLRVRHAMHQELARDARERGYATALERGAQFAREDAGFRRGIRAGVAHLKEREALARDALAAGALAGSSGDGRSPEELMIAEQEQARLVACADAAMAGLARLDRMLLRAIYWEGLGLAEAARRLGLGYHQAHYRHRVAIGVLERQLERASIIRARHR